MREESVVEPELVGREMGEEEVKTSVRNPVLKQKYKAQRGRVGLRKVDSTVRSGVGRRRAPEPPSDADDPIIEATGRTDSRKRAKSLARVVTPEKLKGKRSQSTSSAKQRPRKKVKGSADARDAEERRSSRGRSKGRHSKTGAEEMEILPADKFHMSIRGGNTEIDVTLTSPMKRILNTHSTCPSSSESEDARDTEASVRSRGGERTRSSRKVPFKSKSSRKLLLLPAVETIIADAEGATPVTEEDVGEHSHKHGKEDHAGRPEEILSTNEINLGVGTEHRNVCNQSDTERRHSNQLAVEEGGVGPSDRRTISLISGEASPTRSPASELEKAHPAVVHEENPCRVQVDKASPTPKESVVQQKNQGETSTDMYEPAATEPSPNTSKISYAMSAEPLSRPPQVSTTVDGGLPTLGVDSSGSGGGQGRSALTDLQVSALPEQSQAEKSNSFANHQTKAVKFGCSIVHAIPAPSFRSSPPNAHGKDCPISRGGRFQNPGGSASSALTTVSTPQMKNSATPSTTLASALSGSNTGVGCSAAPRSLATTGTVGAVRSQETRTLAAPVRNSPTLSSSDAVVVTRPGPPCNLLRATLQAASLRSPPAHTYGKDCLISTENNFRNQGGSASSNLWSVTTPPLKKSGTPSTAFASTAGACNPPGGCSPPPRSLATTGSAGAVRFQGRLTPAGAVGTSPGIASADVVVITTPGTPCNVLQKTLQAPSFRSPPSHTHGKDCALSRGGNLKNPGGSASSALTSVTTPQVKDTSTPSTALGSTSGTTKPPRSPTTGGSNPPVPCSALPSSSGTIEPATAVACQEALVPDAAVGTPAAIPSLVPAVLTTSDTPAVGKKTLSSELSVRQQLKAMLEKMTPGDQATWLRESAEDLLQRSKGVEGEIGKSKRKDRMEKEGGRSQKFPASDITRDRTEREASQIARKQKHKEKKRKKAEEERRKAVEESERQHKVRQVDRRMKELESYHSKLMSTEKGKGANVLMSARESQKRTPSTIQGGAKDLQHVKQVSVLSKKKVSSTPPAVSSDASGSTNCSDPLLLGVWEAPKDIPPIKMNSLRRPIGRYWEHLSNFAFKRAAMTFPNWDISWPRQNSVRKLLFVERLKELYPGGWDAVWIMQKVGGNIRQRRVRMRNNFKKFNRKENAPVPPGLALVSWNAIYDQFSNPKYQEKADKCKMVAEERSRRKAFSHKLGPKGVAGLITKFSDEFDREPTEEEVFFGKEHGVPSLIEYTHEKLKKQKSTPKGGLIKSVAKKSDGKGSTSQGRGQSSKQQKKVKQQPQKENESTSEESARTSSSDEDEDFGGGSGRSEETNDSDEDKNGERDEDSESQAEEDDENDEEVEEDSGQSSGSEDDEEESNSDSPSE